MSLTDDLEYLQAPGRTQEQILGFIGAKLARIEEHQGTDFARLNNHEKAINKIEKRCAERGGTGQCEPVKDRWSPAKIATIAVIVATAIATGVLAAVKVLS
jgi:hypothetical protein